MLAGGWGTGKTTAICLEMSKDIQIPNNYILLGRKDLQELKSTTLKEFLDIYSPAIIDHNKQDREIKFNNGTVIYYTNLDVSREAIKKIQSLNLGACYIDQAEEIDESLFIAITGRLRRQEARRCFVGAMNPAGHDWIWQTWKDKKKNDDYEIFIATTVENVYLPKDYIKALLEMPEKWVKRYVYCSFDDFEGTVYNEFIESKHKIGYYEPAETEQLYIIEDYGFRNPNCVLFVSVDYDGVARIYDEDYEAGRLISNISKSIKTRKGWERAIKLADP
jgi:phage terminase large subunit